MQELILYIDISEVREGKLNELKIAIGELADFVNANVPRAISYNVYFSENNTRMSVVQLHPDSASLEFHIKIGGPHFQKFKDLLRLISIDVYGHSEESLLNILRQKSQLLGSGDVQIHDWHAGFTRL